MTQRLTKALREEVTHLQENIGHMELLGLTWEARKLRKRMEKLLGEE